MQFEELAPHMRPAASKRDNVVGALRFGQPVVGSITVDLQDTAITGKMSGCPIAAAKESALSSFATGIASDRSAVRAALVQPWSNGQTEGQITRSKCVKRQMYGRAKIDLLEARLIGVG